MVSEEVISLRVWARTERVLITTFTHAVERAYSTDHDVVMVRSDPEWRAAYNSWRQETDL